MEDRRRIFSSRPLHPSLRCLALALALAGLAGCASNGGVMDKAMQSVGLKQAPPPVDPAKTQIQLPLALFAGPNLNAGNTKQAVPLVVKIYHLRALERFEQTGFDTFLDDDKVRAALGPDLIDEREILVLPAQKYKVTEKMTGDTQQLGVVGLFRAPAAKRWRFAYDVKGSQSTGITLGLHACALSSTTGALINDMAESPGSLANVRCAATDP
jgi:type VI secretion system protein VasD